MRRVVITGMGMVSPLGVGVDHNWDSILAGKSGLGKIEHFDASEHPSKIAGMVPRTSDENPTNGAFNADLFVRCMSVGHVAYPHFVFRRC